MPPEPTLAIATEPFVMHCSATGAVRAGEPPEVTQDGEVADTLPGSFGVAGDAFRVIGPPGCAVAGVTVAGTVALTAPCAAQAPARSCHGE